MGKSLRFNNEKILSVSLVLYCNEVDELRTVLECTLKSKLVGKIYLVDNSPTNDLRSFKKIDEYRIVYLFQNKNLGFGRGHNRAILRSKNEGYTYHLILNPDIEFKGKVLEKLHDYMEMNSNCGMVTPKVFYKNGDLQHLCKKIPSASEMFGKRLPIKALQERINKNLELHHFKYNKVLNVPYLSGCFMFCRMASFEKVGMFDNRYFMYMEDLDLSRRFHEFYETIFFPEVNVIHGFRGESRVNIKLLIALIFSAIKYFNKFGWLYDKERVAFNKKLSMSISKLNEISNLD